MCFWSLFPLISFHKNEGKTLTGIISEQGGVNNDLSFNLIYVSYNHERNYPHCCIIILQSFFCNQFILLGGFIGLFTMEKSSFSRIFIKEGRGAGEIFLFKHDEMIIGRAEDSDLVIDSPLTGKTIPRIPWLLLQRAI
jgi:hypothetical protein